MRYLLAILFLVGSGFAEDSHYESTACALLFSAFALAIWKHNDDEKAAQEEKDELL